MDNQSTTMKEINPVNPPPPLTEAAKAEIAALADECMRGFANSIADEPAVVAD